MKKKDGASQEDAQCQPSPRSVSHVVSPYHGDAAGLGLSEPCMRFQDLIVEKCAQRTNKVRRAMALREFRNPRPAFLPHNGRDKESGAAGDSGDRPGGGVKHKVVSGFVVERGIVPGLTPSRGGCLRS